MSQNFCDTRYMSNKGEGESEPGEKKIKPTHNTNDIDERAYILRCCSSERSADDRNIDLQWSKR